MPVAYRLKLAALWRRAHLRHSGAYAAKPSAVNSRWWGMRWRQSSDGAWTACWRRSWYSHYPRRVVCCWWERRRSARRLQPLLTASSTWDVVRLAGQSLCQRRARAGVTAGTGDAGLQRSCEKPTRAPAQAGSKASSTLGLPPFDSPEPMPAASTRLCRPAQATQCLQPWWGRAAGSPWVARSRGWRANSRRAWRSAATSHSKIWLTRCRDMPSISAIRPWLWPWPASAVTRLADLLDLWQLAGCGSPRWRDNSS